MDLTHLQQHYRELVGYIEKGYTETDTNISKSSLYRYLEKQ